jgi:hypothetical protein
MVMASIIIVTMVSETIMWGDALAGVRLKVLLWQVMAFGITRPTHFSLCFITLCPYVSDRY